MRKLTITRHTSFAAVLAKVKVYIEDPSSTEIKINEVPCRKLGTLADGETKTFEIEESELRVFVIGDKLSKDYCSDFYRIPAGSENISLSGQNRLNPANGNAFLFDNNNTEEAAASRSKGKKKGIKVLVIASIIGGIIGVGIVVACIVLLTVLSSVRQTMEIPFANDEYRITLTGGFREVNLDNFYAAYNSKKVYIYVVKEEFSLAEGFGDLNLTEYGKLVTQSNPSADGSTIKNSDGLTYFTYDAYLSGQNADYRYYTFVFKGDDSFWIFSFVVLADKAAENEQFIFDAAKSIEFTSAN